MSQMSLWVKSGLPAPCPFTSAIGGEADGIRAKVDIADGMSEVGGTPDLPWTRPEGPFIAKRRHLVPSQYIEIEIQEWFDTERGHLLTERDSRT